MSKSSQQSTGRNDPCPCGSGRKFKRCCEGKTWTRNDAGQRRQWFNPFTVLIVAVFVGSLAVWGVSNMVQPAAPTGPQPWEYDEERNRYFDPRAGHGHWHQGTPPPEDER